jgi:alpha-beta hydrolase superfamily lysophospholipase
MASSSEHFETFDGLRLFARRREPEGRPPLARVLIVHGYAEHSGRYEELVERLLAAGYGVGQFDLRGHGRSEGRRGYVRSFDDYLRDLERFSAREREYDSVRPIFVLGHSLGGLIVAHWAINCSSPVAGVILSGAALKINEDIHPWLQRLSGLIGAIAPRLPTIRLDTRAISRDPEVVRRFHEDPLVFHGRMPARTGAEIVRASRQIGGQLSKLVQPVLLMHGTADRLTDPEGGRQAYERAASTDKTLKLYPGLYHEIFNEPEHKQVVDDLIGWLDAQT